MTIGYELKQFVEDVEGPIYIYGADNAGFWVGNLLNRCGITWFGYIDDRIIHKGVKLNGKVIESASDIIEQYRTKEIRIIIASIDYENKIETIDNKCKDMENVHCCIPLARVKNTDTFKYDINVFLAYLRNKLITKPLPTIFANNCSAGLMYKWLGSGMMSPTINSFLNYHDFKKMISDPRKYCNGNTKNAFWTKNIWKFDYSEVPTISVDDIEILFAHTEDLEDTVEKWKYLCSKINWKDVRFIMTDKYSGIPNDVIKTYCELKAKKLLLLNNTNVMYGNSLDKNTVIIQKDIFFNRSNTAIENDFDLIGWINDSNVE